MVQVDAELSAQIAALQVSLGMTRDGVVRMLLRQGLEIEVQKRRPRDLLEEQEDSEDAGKLLARIVRIVPGEVVAMELTRREAELLMRSLLSHQPTEEEIALLSRLRDHLDREEQWLRRGPIMGNRLYGAAGTLND